MYFFLPRSRKKQWLILIPRDALQGHRRGKKPVAYVFITRDTLRAARVKKRVGYLFRRRHVFTFFRRSHKW